jgi:acetyl-CoA synthetase
VLHTTGGYMLGTYLTTRYVFDLKDDDVYWCTADIGWVTGHSYIVYGPLANGATQVMYEGAPNWPGARPLLGDRRKVPREHLLHRAHRHPRSSSGATEHPEKHDLSSLRLLGTVGEPINPEAWMWYHRVIGGRTAAPSSTPGGRPKPAAS